MRHHRKNERQRGFYQLYSIDTESGRNRTQSKSSRVIGLSSPWGVRGAILKEFRWTYDYLLWGISWINVQLMLDDAAKTIDIDPKENTDVGVEKRNLNTKEDIINYLKGQL